MSESRHTGQPSLPRDLMIVLTHLPVEGVDLFLRDLLTPAEIETLSERWEIIKQLANGKSQRSISEAVGASVTTVSRGNRQLKYGEGGFKRALDQLAVIHGAGPVGAPDQDP